MEREPGAEGARRALGRLLQAVLASRGEANAVFDILTVLQVSGARRGEAPGPRDSVKGRGGGREVTLLGIPSQSEDPEEIQEAIHTCSRLFGALLERRELFVGQLPPEDVVLAGERPGGGWGARLRSGETPGEHGVSPQALPSAQAGERTAKPRGKLARPCACRLA